jgi:hypothetical protein
MIQNSSYPCPMVPERVPKMRMSNQLYLMLESSVFHFCFRNSVSASVSESPLSVLGFRFPFSLSSFVSLFCLLFHNLCFRFTLSAMV